MLSHSKQQDNGNSLLAVNGIGRKQVARMALLAPSGQRGGLVLATCFALLLALGAVDFWQVDCQEQLTVDSRQQKDNDDLTDTIKYLEKLDKYFSQIARPRFGRAEYKQQQQQQLHRQPAAMLAFAGQQPGVQSSAEPQRLGWLVELVNSRLARRYAEANY